MPVEVNLLYPTTFRYNIFLNPPEPIEVEAVLYPTTFRYNFYESAVFEAYRQFYIPLRSDKRGCLMPQGLASAQFVLYPTTIRHNTTSILDIPANIYHVQVNLHHKKSDYLILHPTSFRYNSVSTHISRLFSIIIFISHFVHI